MTGLIIIIGNYIGGISSGSLVDFFMIDQSGADFIISESGDNIIKE